MPLELDVSWTPKLGALPALLSSRVTSPQVGLTLVNTTISRLSHTNLSFDFYLYIPLSHLNDPPYSGTSSRSTKLIHGGIRYLQNAILKLDKEQWDLVCEALAERKNMLDSAPHLSAALPIMIPVYSW